MSYIILNGKKSTMVKGLMIQSLPPITKPLMRTNIETIDGRDGDIVNKLGYAAYDREMSIGLFGDYDIAEVMEYFNSEGEAVFSNELGRKYRYQIIDQIDYERLGIFRQAKVKFHVQPFKYSTTQGFALYQSYEQSDTVYNYGNVISKPTIYVEEATGPITLTFPRGTIEISSDIVDKPIGINTETMNAYEVQESGSSNVRLNRYVTCDYENFGLDIGKTEYSVECGEGGSFRAVYIINMSRWI